MIGLRLADEQIEALDERAVAEDLLTKAGEPNRSELLRIMIEYAQENMPAGWRPEGWVYRG
ncbi:hypothetical protein ACFPPE_07260 [Agromyces tardus]|uniref:hypothetical protein n=1 Tax=Agromyces tardus TaxID=2583849 RepID=UPI003610EA0E